VQQGRLDQACKLGRHVGRLGAGRGLAQKPAPRGRPSLLDNGCYQMPEDECIAADIPSRLQPDSGMNGTDAVDSGGIVSAEIARRDDAPMALLKRLRAIHLLVACEEAPGLWGGPYPFVESVEGGAERFLYDR